MIPMGLTSAQRRRLIAALFAGYTMRIRVQSTTLDGTFDADLTGRVLDGQVSVDGTGDVTRTASLTLLDENRTLDFTSDSPSEAALYLDRMIRIWYGVRADLGDGPEWVDVPIFTGPITSLSRTGAEVSVEAQGKESLGMGAVWKPLTLNKGRTKVSAIRIILRERAGERLFDFPQLAAGLPKALTLNREDVPWTRARSIARSLDRQLFYDGRGTCRLRRQPATPVLTFTADTLLSPLAVSYTQDATVNAVFVRGGIPKNGKVQIAAEAFPPRNHPLSPWRLGRTNQAGTLVPRYLMETVEDTHIRSLAEARRIARARLAHGLAQGVDASFDALPVPMLEPGDMVRAVTDEGAVTFRVQTFALSLAPGQPMTVGYVRNLATRRRGQVTVRGNTPEYRKALAAYRARAAKKATAHKSNAAQPKTHRTAVKR